MPDGIAIVATDFIVNPPGPAQGLIHNGYEPVPCVGKAPKNPGWQAGEMTPERFAEMRAAIPAATNTRLRTGRLVGVDIDLRDPAHVTAIKKLAVDVLGFTGMERVGSKGAMLCYRNATPISKITVRGLDYSDPGNRIKPRSLIEVHGTGQQFVAFGDHPGTGKPYQWPNDWMGCEPLQTPLADLPKVTPDQLRAFAVACQAKLIELGYRDVEVSHSGTHKAAREAVRRESRAPVPKDYLTRMLAYVPPECGRPTWIGCLGGIQATCLDGVLEQDMDAELVEIAQAWSRGDYCDAVPSNWGRDPSTGQEFDGDGDVEDNYFTLSPDRAGGTGFGTLHRIAKENGWTERAPGTVDDRVGSEKWDGHHTPAPTRRRFQGYTPEEGAALPDLEYFDRAKTLPIVPGGCHGTSVGKKASHKSGVAIKKGLDAIFEKGARVLYIAGEGGHGIAKIRLQRHLEARGKTLQDIEGHWITVPVSPNITKAADIDELVAEYRELAPNLVFVDTLTRATAGVDINSPQTGTDVTEGALRLAAAFNATVVLIGHPPLSGGQRTLGSVLIPDHAFFNWAIEYDKASGIVTQHLINMKDGPDDFPSYFRCTMVRDVPVIVDCQERPAPKRELPVKEVERREFRRQVADAIKDRAAAKGDKPTVVSDLASWMGRHEPEADNAIESIRKRLFRQIPNMRDLMMCSATGQTLSSPYTFKPWAQIADLFPSTSLASY